MVFFSFLFYNAGSLMYLNEATLLNNVRVRYSKDKIYVSIKHRWKHAVFTFSMFRLYSRFVSKKYLISNETRQYPLFQSVALHFFFQCSLLFILLFVTHLDERFCLCRFYILPETVWSKGVVLLFLLWLAIKLYSLGRFRKTCFDLLHIHLSWSLRISSQ